MLQRSESVLSLPGLCALLEHPGAGTGPRESWERRRMLSGGREEVKRIEGFSYLLSLSFLVRRTHEDLSDSHTPFR
jgi:hypothetical protein